MASTSLKGNQIVVAANELVGYKSGLALSREQMIQLLSHAPDQQRLLLVPDDQFIRFRLEEFEHLVTELLFKLGVSDTPDPGTPLLIGPYIGDPIKGPVAVEIGELWVKHLWREINAIKNGRETRSIDPTPFVYESEKKHGRLGAQIALEIVGRLIEYERRNPWTPERIIEWGDTKALDELFKSENLATSHGKYFDQRFINYLHQNFEDIGAINWRQFEALAGEYLDREGFTVELGPGRNDGSIDIRAWAKGKSVDLPPTVLVQCKREKTKVGKVVVKALWADIHEEKAQSGLIVTSNALSPGARKVCRARNYPIQEANRETLRRWIKAMRIPGSGIFLSE